MNPGVNRLLSLAALLLLGACAGPTSPLVVKSFQLRDQVRDQGEEPMVRMEKERRLRGAVSMAERRERLGQYYTILWNDPAGAGTGPVEVAFEYQQGGSGSRVKRMTRAFPSADAHGKASFAIVGEDFFKNGRVLAWQVRLLRGGRELASSRSYLWQ